MFPPATRVLSLSFLYLSFPFCGRSMLCKRGPFFACCQTLLKRNYGANPSSRIPRFVFLLFVLHALVFIFVYFSVLRPTSPSPSFFPSFIKYTCQSAVIIRTATGSVTGYEARADWRPCLIMPVETAADNLIKSLLTMLGFLFLFPPQTSRIHLL